MVHKPLRPMTLSGRDFTKKDFKLIKDTVLLCPHLSRTELAKTIAENLQWYQSNGEPKHRACLIVLEKLQNWGYIQLPPLKETSYKGYRHQVLITKRTSYKDFLIGQIQQYGAVIIEPVRDKEESSLWKEYIERYHYLRYRTPFGCQQKYFIRLETGELLGCLLYSASAWSVECRDKWIGWDREQKSRRLHLIINNSRFLIFPWVMIKNLASKVLSLAAKRVGDDWQDIHHYRPVLMETFVEKDRFRGTCYRAANWQYLGVTRGRGRMDRYNKHISTIKEVFVYPLTSSFRDELKGGEQ